LELKHHIPCDRDICKGALSTFESAAAIPLLLKVQEMSLGTRNISQDQVQISVIVHVYHCRAEGANADFLRQSRPDQSQPPASSIQLDL